MILICKEKGRGISAKGPKIGFQDENVIEVGICEPMIVVDKWEGHVSEIKQDEPHNWEDKEKSQHIFRWSLLETWEVAA